MDNSRQLVWVCNILRFLSVNGIRRCSSRVLHGWTVSVCLHERAAHRANWLSNCSSALHQHITVHILPCTGPPYDPTASTFYSPILEKQGSAINSLTAGEGFYVCCWERSGKKANFGDRKRPKSERWQNDLSSEEVCRCTVPWVGPSGPPMQASSLVRITYYNVNMQSAVMNMDGNHYNNTTHYTQCKCNVMYKVFKYTSLPN